jgi:hypothetical protein
MLSQLSSLVFGPAMIPMTPEFDRHRVLQIVLETNDCGVLLLGKVEMIHDDSHVG